MDDFPSCLTFIVVQPEDIISGLDTVSAFREETMGGFGKQAEMARLAITMPVESWSWLYSARAAVQLSLANLMHAMCCFP